MHFLKDSEEYEARKHKPFRPSQVTMAELRAVVPAHLLQKNTFKGLLFAARDLLFTVVIYKLGWQIDPLCQSLADHHFLPPAFLPPIKASLWIAYWLCQGIALTSCWCLAHEAAHGNISANAIINHAIGFLYHTFLLVPYFAWRSSHQAHHKATVSVERDETYVPPTRSAKGLPLKAIAKASDYHEILEETPIYVFTKIIAMQILGLAFYLAFNQNGSPRYPLGTNHFSPYSALFKPGEFISVLVSDVGLAAVLGTLYTWTQLHGFAAFFNFYLVPWMLCNHWIILLTYLHHSDPTIPYYRASQWSFVRGAISTVDRPLFGWIGRFFFHNVSHNHVSHHLFSSAPFYNQPEITKRIKKVLKDDYNYDTTPIYRALYRTFVECEFIEEDEDIVFYKNRQGKAARVLAPDALEYPPTSIVG